MDPTIDLRVKILGQKFDRIEALLQRLEVKLTEAASNSAKAHDLQTARVDLAEVKGRISTLPTWWMLMVTVLSTWMVGAGIVFTLVKATHP